MVRARIEQHNMSKIRFLHPAQNREYRDFHQIWKHSLCQLPRQIVQIRVHPRADFDARAMMTHTGGYIEVHISRMRKMVKMKISGFYIHASGTYKYAQWAASNVILRSDTSSIIFRHLRFVTAAPGTHMHVTLTCM